MYNMFLFYRRRLIYKIFNLFWTNSINMSFRIPLVNDHYINIIMSLETGFYE